MKMYEVTLPNAIMLGMWSGSRFPETGSTMTQHPESDRGSEIEIMVKHQR